MSTVSKSDVKISSELRKSQTRCETIPRVYSGVAYDICKVHSDSLNTFRHLSYGYYFFDTIPSAIIDTVVLPYTIYKQNDLGSVKVGIQ